MQLQRDDCPPWALDLIMKLRELEIHLGNIPKALAWSSEHLNAVNQRVFRSEEASVDADKTEFIYRRIVMGLMQESFSAQEIAGFINLRIGYTGAPPYTSPEEVAAVAQA